MSDSQKAFGHNVREYRRRRHWKQEYLAARANLSQSEISKIENGNLPRDPSKELIEKLANALEITPESLVSGTPLSSLFSGDGSSPTSPIVNARPPLHPVRFDEEYQREVTIPERTTKRKANDPFRICGTVLNGKYELTEFAGAGGMGAVYRASNITTGETVAVKILQPHIVTRSPECADLFEREVKNAQSLDHPHIVKIFDSGKDEDLSYMVMEWVEGRSVEDVLTQGYLRLNRLTNIFGQICSAVAFAHERNIIHLDIKPGNILLLDRPGSDDFVKVIDFGLSRVISKESGTTVTKFRGTHLYCSPEQFGGKVSHRSDIYSLGITLYYLLTGVIPFGASYINAKMHPNLELPEIPSAARHRNLPQAVDYVLRKALNKNPALRQQSAKELFQEFREALSMDNMSQWRDEVDYERRIVLSVVAIYLLLILIRFVIYPSSGPPKGQSAPDNSIPVSSPATNNSTFGLLPVGSTITGRVTTSRNEGVGGMFVTLSAKDGQLNEIFRVTTTTDDRGVYYLSNLAVGQYDIELYKPNYASKLERGLNISPNSIIIRDISLLPSDMTGDAPTNPNR